MLKGVAKKFPKATDKKFDEIRTDIDKRLDKTDTGIKGILERGTIETGSPPCLTGRGNKIFAMIDAKGWATLMADAAQDAVSGMKPHEIHEFSFDNTHRTLEMTAEQEDTIGAAAYENGVSRDEALDVLAIALRDILLERNGHPVPKRKDDSASA